MPYHLSVCDGCPGVGWRVQGLVNARLVRNPRLMAERNRTASATIEAGMRRAMRRSWLVVHSMSVAIVAVTAETVFASGQRFSTPGVIAMFGAAAFMWASLSLVLWTLSRSHLRAARRADTVVDVAGRRFANEIDAQRGNWK